MDVIVGILYWAELLLLGLAVIAAVVVAVRNSGSRTVVPWRLVTQVVLAAAVFAAAFFLAGAGSSPLWTVVLLALGAVLGYLLGGVEHQAVGGERGPGVRRAGVVPWLWALSLVLVVLTLLFGSTFLYGIAVLVLAFALGLVAGQVAGELVSASRVRVGAPPLAPPAPPPVAPPAPPPV